MRTTRKSHGLLVALGLLAVLAAALQTTAGDTVARNGRFVRGTGSNPEFQSFVIPLDLQTGVALDNIGGNNTNLPPFNSWTNDVYYHYNATNTPSATGTNGRIAFTGPIAAFGGRIGGSKLYARQQ